MKKHMDLGGSVTLPGTSMTLNRMGYDAMQLAGPQVWGPPRDVGSRRPQPPLAEQQPHHHRVPDGRERCALPTESIRGTQG